MYQPPVKDMLFVLQDLLDIKTLPQSKAADLDDNTISAILDEAARLARDVLAPLNYSGDEQGCTLEDGDVKTADGFKEAYAQYRDSGWNAVPFNPEFGGQGLPVSLAFATQEMWQGANMAFGLCPLLNQAAVEAIEHHGTEEQQKTYLEKLISGQWTGTMNLTEPHAGTDLGLLKTKAEKQDDGSYKISGQKIYITYGEHDMAENIIHLVLARTPDAPDGVKGISMFVVPKFIPDENGNPGQKNDLICSGIEHKLGIHASPTCTMQFGDEGGATGWLIGSENEGLKYMFTMMNNARLSVGLQGVAISERAYQHALTYAKERKQGSLIHKKDGETVAIIEHPDVQRMLLTMKALTEAGRALTYEAAYMLDLATTGDTKARARVDLLTPIVKAWCTDRAVDVASIGIQVHGGMGFVEETGAAQYYRDARILPIYEGTNSIQALDLHGRKILRDKGEAAFQYIDDTLELLHTFDAPELKSICDSLKTSLETLRKTTIHLLNLPIEHGAAINVPYLNLFGTVTGGVMLARKAAISNNDDHTKLASFYTTHILPSYKSYADTVMHGAESVDTINTDYFKA